MKSKPWYGPGNTHIHKENCKLKWTLFHTKAAQQSDQPTAHFLPPIGLLTVYEMYGRSESEHILGPGEMLPGLVPSPLSGPVSLSGTDLPLCRLARPTLEAAGPCCELCSDPIVLPQLEKTKIKLNFKTVQHEIRN